jgi:oligogalacturonide lyase
MIPPSSRGLACIAALFVTNFLALAADQPPTDWIDPDTGHRIVRLSTEPGSGSLYFNQNAYTAAGDKVIITTPEGISTIDLKTRKIDVVVKGKVHVIMAARKSREVYYLQDGVIYAANLDTHATRKIGTPPPHGSVATLNADETLLAGSTASGGAAWQSSGATPGTTSSALPGTSGTQHWVGPDGKPATYAEHKEQVLNARMEQHLPMTLFTLNTKTGEVKTFFHSTDWLNHLQFSPTNPTLLMFCHEGPWHKVDRIWTIRTDGTQLTKIHTRTMNMEIAGHEFWSADGKTIWYDLQTPRGQDFWLAGYAVGTGARTWYHLERNEWSVHYNVSRDGSLFAGDGGDSEMVAHAPDGKWIYLFRPQPIPDVAGISAPDSAKLIRPGYFQSERLVNMSRHNYELEPNVTFSPDMKWILFRSNMFGPEQVFAVEIAKATPMK